MHQTRRGPVVGADDGVGSRRHERADAFPVRRIQAVHEIVQRIEDAIAWWEGLENSLRIYDASAISSRAL